MSTSKTTNNGGLIQPAKLYSESYISIGEGESAQKILVTEFVKQGQILCEFPVPIRQNNPPESLQPLIAGNNAKLSDDGYQIFATKPGYPKTASIEAEEGGNQHLVFEVEPLIRVTEDSMKASIALHPPVNENNPLAKEDLEEILSSSGIRYGLDTDKIKQVEEYIKEALPEFSVFTIAQGKESVPGVNASLEFHIEIGPIAGLILPDGTIDFRERRIMVPVSKGDVIASKIPATSGEPGTTVRGETVEPIPGKDIAIKTERDAKYSRETNQVVASENGLLSIVKNQVIRVCSRQKISGDIDYETGNLESRNCVSVDGSVQPGFTVHADGDLKIEGGVSSATLQSLSNIVVKGGITGKKTTIEAAGDTDILFIEQGKLKCGGRSVIRKQCYYSTIHAGGDIRCKADTITLGSELLSGGSISVGDVGSEDSTPTLLAAGVDADRITQYRKIKEKLAIERDEVVKWLQKYKGSAKSRKIRTMERGIEEMKMQLLRMNMIPGTGIYSRAGIPDEPGAENNEDYSNKSGISLKNISIEVAGTIFAGTKIQIGNRSMTVEKTISKRIFRLTDNQKRILVLPKRK